MNVQIEHGRTSVWDGSTSMTSAAARIRYQQGNTSARVRVEETKVIKMTLWVKGVCHFCGFCCPSSCS